jgi:hypothetical protein
MKLPGKMDWKVMDQTTIESLRARMDHVGCIFEFVVVTPDCDAPVDESMHRQALNELHHQIMAGLLDWHQKLIRNLPDADYPEPILSWDLDKAVTTPLTRKEVRTLTLTEVCERRPLALYANFSERAAPNEFEDEGVQELFREWLEVLGLEVRDDVVVLNWVKRPEREFLDTGIGISGRESWSEYFETASGWSGAWCLTIWNPRSRTLSAIAACTTD